jgi:formylglycine-generating enzyme required for sulfatase activity
MGWLLLSPDARALAAVGALLSLAGCANPGAGGPVRSPAQPVEPALADLQVVRVPGGLFRVGSPSGPDNERPPHLVIVQPFRLSRYAVTVGQFAQFVKETGYQTDAELNHGEGPGCRVSGSAEQPAAFQAGTSWRAPGFVQTDSQPVVCVSYNDSHAFLAWLNGHSPHHFRLPSEAEWEFSARADSGSDTPAEGCAHEGPATGTPCASPTGQNAGSSKPNRFGLYELLGSGTELVEDCWHADYKHAPRTGYAWTSHCDENQQITIVGASTSPGTGVNERRAGLGRTSADNRLGFRIAEDMDSAHSVTTPHY